MHIEVLFEPVSDAQKDLLIAHLADQAEGFEETETGLKVIFLAGHYDATTLRDLADQYQLSFTQRTIATQNWNAVWESNFSPVLVDGFVGIRAAFHPSVQGVEHEIVITPKMSFGTGHHATTYLMIQQMRNINFKHKAVFDFGTGTGVLAILAHQLGAARVLASDIDDWSIANARENFERNDATGIELIQSDSGSFDRLFDVILANINRNILAENIPALATQLQPGGHLILSGLLEADSAGIKSQALDEGLRFIEKTGKEHWISLCFKK